MEEFLNKLYSYEYFGTYLIISIVVLVLLFIIVFFFGKKDKKEREIIATKKLQQINNDAFKDDSIEEKLEITNEEKLENDTIIVPTINEIPTIMEVSENEIPDPVLPTQQEINELIEEPLINIAEINVADSLVAKGEEVVEEVVPLLEKVEEKPIMFNDIKVEEEKTIEPIDIKLEAPKVEKEEIEVPTFNFDEIIKSVEETKKEQKYTKGPEIFSSVYVPEKEKIEIPKIVEKKETKTDNDFEFELPMLKRNNQNDFKEENESVIKKNEMPVLNDYNLDNLSGETYTINK